MHPHRLEQNRSEDPAGSAATASRGTNAAVAARVLIAAGPAGESLAARVSSFGYAAHVAHDARDARRLVAATEFDAAIISRDFAGGSWRDLCRHLARHSLETQMIVLMDEEVFSAAIEAVREGAIDVIVDAADDALLRERLERAIMRSREARQQAQRLRRLRAICRRLTSAVHDSKNQIDRLRQDVMRLADDSAVQIAEAAMAAEFRTLLSQELDLEAMLRTALEYLLMRTGPTNAAVFLPDADDHFSLGAYVNFDCPREAAAVLLEHLCLTICPGVRQEPDILRFEDSDEFASHLGEHAAIIEGREIIAFRCTCDGRTYAVIVLFRDRTDPFDDALPGVLDTLRSIFAAQLQSILRVHHRARSPWPREAAEDVGDVEDDFGFGLAA